MYCFLAVPPSITKTTNNSVKIGSQATIQCSGNGLPIPTIDIYRKGDIIHNSSVNIINFLSRKNRATATCNTRRFDNIDLAVISSSVSKAVQNFQLTAALFIPLKPGVGKLFTRKTTFKKILKPRAALIGRAKKNLHVLRCPVFF